MSHYILKLSFIVTLRIVFTSFIFFSIAIVLVHHHSNFPKTTKHLVSWWVQEQVSPRSEVSGNRDYMTLNTKVGFFSFLRDVLKICNGFSLPPMKLQTECSIHKTVINIFFQLKMLSCAPLSNNRIQISTSGQ